MSRTVPVAEGSTVLAATTPAAAAAVQVPPAPSLGQIDEDFHRLVLGLPQAQVGESSAAEQAMLRRLGLLSTRFDLRSLPRLPTVLPQLLRTLKSDEAAGGELAKLVGRDPLMVGEVMRATSTVFYRSAQPISSLQQAVVLLGQDGLRRVITQHVMKPILRANAGTRGHSAGERLWAHAERCAHLCAWLGRYIGCDSFEAYLGGIVRHAGTGALVRLLDQLMPGETPTALSSSFVRSCSALANRLSLQAARQWELPARVLQAMAECQSPITATASPLGRALSLADSIASARVLVDNDRMSIDTDLSHCWPDIMSPTLIARGQRDLDQHLARVTAAS
ncbi:MAG: HDOD domain-containing protein [Rhodanobacter sp.]